MPAGVRRSDLIAALLVLGLAAPLSAERVEIACPDGTELVRTPDGCGEAETCVTPERLKIGPQIYRFCDGSPSLYGAFRMPREDEDYLAPVPTGPQLIWWENGALKDVGVHRGGQRDGPWIHWRRDGSIERIEIFRNGWLVDLYGEAGPIPLDCPRGSEPRQNSMPASRLSLPFEKWCVKTLPDGTPSYHGPAVSLGREGEIAQRWQNRTYYSPGRGGWVRLTWLEGETRRRCWTLSGTGIACPEDLEGD